MESKTMKEPLNEIEQKIWESILQFLEDNKQMPLRMELAEVLSTKEKEFSPQLLQYWLESIQKKGWIDLITNTKRNIRLK